MSARESSPVVCVFCRLPVRRWVAVMKTSAHDVDCDVCGKYRLTSGSETMLRSIANLPVNPWLKYIATANADGDRLSIPDGMRIRLEER